MSKLLSRLALAAGVPVALMLTPSSAWAAPLASQDPTPTTLPPDGGAGTLAAAGGWLLGASVLVVIAGLAFAYFYHKRLLDTIDAAGKAGRTVVAKSLEAIALTADGKVGVSGPTQATIGERVTFAATGYDHSSGVSWTVERVKADPSTGAGQTLEVTFEEAGTAVVTATETGKQSLPHNVAVSAPSREVTGIVLPFAIQNWGRLVVTILGVGVVSALMAWDVISAEGGIGLLGALLGVGAATAAKDEVSKPTSET